MSKWCRGHGLISCNTKELSVFMSAKMQGSSGNNKNVIKTRPGCPPLEINTNMKKATKAKSGIISAERCITYAVGKRRLFLTITEVGYAGRVNLVRVELTEENGKGSCANLSMRHIRDDKYGVLHNITTELAGSYDSFKESYCVPPLDDTELICYFCRDTGLGSCFTVAKKKAGMEFVAKVKATHAFVIDDELTVNVSVKITNNLRGGLSVVVEGPTKLTLDYTKQVVSTIRGKMDRQMEANTLYLFQSGMRQLPSDYYGKDTQDWN